ncbi:hypothetical protein ACFVXE_08630 [Streptomyces sp. NPDC058231]|uniref:hypothetical protein n=1 Tax=Streptomyces sp. NPDC058231 TaxID=3346392 RepID=UPI0036E6B874
MPSRSRCHDLLRPAAARINARIRQLIDEEHDQEHRAAEYGRLLLQWADVTRTGDLYPAV